MTQRSNETNEIAASHQSGCRPFYRIEIKGLLDESWSDWFSGLTIENWRTEDGSTHSQLTGPVTDQSTLRGILNKIWDLNLILISVVLIQYRAEAERPVPPAENN
jgi:hypothetical protein